MRGSSPGGLRRSRDEAGGTSPWGARCSDAPGACAARRGGSGNSTAVLLLFGNMLGGGDAEKKGKEKLGGSWLQSQAKGQTECHTAMSVRHFPPTPRSLHSQPPRHRRASLPTRPEGQHARGSRAGVPGLRPPQGAACHGQASKFPSGTSCSSFGPSRSASAAARQGWGGRGGGSRPQDSCPPRRNLSHRQTHYRLCREGTQRTHMRVGKCL